MNRILSGLLGIDEDENNKNKNQDNNNSNGNQGSNSDQGSNTANSTNNSQGEQSGKMVLHKEELDINKNNVDTGEVILSKEVVEEQQSLDVPVTHEEVVIERKALNNESTSDTIGCSNETIKIPVSEEQVQVNKRTVATGEVTAYKRQVEQTQHIEQTLQREEARIDKNGHPAIISESDTNSDQNSSSGSTCDTGSMQ